ncbi:hypothetical protein CQW23_13978 [Capsicum baccatum]|uniref:Retrotransposon Copia-like N-terminal domain-containing protein n=1 Tax=Capsicum baccatum TaxID=33114 RepID=A0A2G2WI48_CAPBA|nr:hypothetical protein CQW23_13978 [Capsicum baccatum]
MAPRNTSNENTSTTLPNNSSTKNTSTTPSHVASPSSLTILTMNKNEQLISINVVAQAPLKLNNAYYQSWKYQWETILTACDFLHFIELPPSSIDTPFHKRQDHLIRSAIVASLSSDVVPFVIDTKFSYALWQNLAATYAKLSPLHSRETPVTYEELHEKLLDFEQNLVHSSSSSTVPITTNFAAKPSPHNNRSQPNHASHPGNNSNQFAANNSGAQFDGQNNQRNRPRVTC